MRQAEQSNFKTLEGYIRSLLVSHALKPQNEIAEEILQELKLTEQRYGTFADSSDMDLSSDVRDETI